MSACANRPLYYRYAHAAVFALGIVSLLVAYLFMERYLGLAPCPLCIVDRLIVAIICLVALAAFAHNPHLVGQRVYAGVNAAFGALGVAVAARHIWLQQQSAGFLGGCAPEVDYLFDRLPLAESLWAIFNATGDCSEVAWTFLGLSIPEQTLLLFALFTALNLGIALAAFRRRAAPTR